MRGRYTRTLLREGLEQHAPIQLSAAQTPAATRTQRSALANAASVYPTSVGGASPRIIISGLDCSYPHEVEHRAVPEIATGEHRIVSPVSSAAALLQVVPNGTTRDSLIGPCFHAY